MTKGHQNPKLQITEITYKYDPEAAERWFVMWSEIVRRRLNESISN